jgi:hypothetical protein
MIGVRCAQNWLGLGARTTTLSTARIAGMIQHEQHALSVVQKIASAKAPVRKGEEQC